MALMTGTDTILHSIERGLADARTEIARLTAARAALTAGETPAAARPEPAPVKETEPTPAAVAPKRRRATRRANSRGARVVPSSKLETLLAATDGLSTAALADRAGGDSAQVLPLLRDLERVGKIRRSGQRRGTRWHLITEDDRIRERAAELEALVRRAG
jgi:hypothetical protein